MTKYKNGVGVTATAGNSVYDIYMVTGASESTEFEVPEVIYHEELRGNGSTEQSVLDEYATW